MSYLREASAVCSFYSDGQFQGLNKRDEQQVRLSRFFIYNDKPAIKGNTSRSLPALAMIKNFTKFLTGSCIAILSLLSLVSCEKKEEATIVFGFACSEDVLEYVQPTVTYFDNNNKKVEKILTRDDFREEKFLNADRYIWTVGINYNHGDIENVCEITFNQIKPIDKEKISYFYLAELKGNGSYEKEQTGFFSTSAIASSMSAGMLLKLPELNFEEQFKKSINQLVSYGLRATVRIDDKGAIYSD